MFETVEEIAAHYVKIILQEDSSGPYVVAGFSFGGFTALEVAHQLAALGKKIELTLLFDTYPHKEGKFTYFHMYIPYVLRSWANYLLNPSNTLKSKVSKTRVNL
ncbi:hypothetical protein HMI54_013976, partial [Coelomomyces lativittatus]